MAGSGGVKRTASMAKRRELDRARHRAMIRRRFAALQNVLYLVLLGICCSVTWGLWNGGTGPSLLTTYITYATLVWAISLSDAVPLGRPKPNLAAGIAIVLWALALTRAAIVAAYSGDLSGVFFYAIPSLWLPFLFRKRIKYFPRTSAWIGAAVVVGSLFLGVDLLTGPGAPAPMASGIGFTSRATTSSTEGLVLHLDVYPEGCSSVLAAVHVFGSTEFWAHHRHIYSHRLELQLVVPAGTANHLQVLAVTDPLVAHEETLPGSELQSVSPIFKGGEVDHTPVRPLNFRAGLTNVIRVGKYEVINAWVTSSWASARGPIAFWFRPNWLTQNGLQSCYLETPPLVGARLWPNIDSPVWKHIDHDHLALPSSASVTLHNAAYAAGPSLPDPAIGDNESYTWSCDIAPKGEVDISKTEKLSTYGISDYREAAHPRDCGEMTPLEETTAPTFKNLVIFLIGGLISLGLTVLVRSRRPARA